MDYVKVLVQIQGEVLEMKSGKTKKGKEWFLCRLKNGKGHEDIFVDKNYPKGAIIKANGEMWKIKDNNNVYKFVFKNMKVVDVQGGDSVTFN